jgi:hypothetical protein
MESEMGLNPRPRLKTHGVIPPLSHPPYGMMFKPKNNYTFAFISYM